MPEHRRPGRTLRPIGLALLLALDPAAPLVAGPEAVRTRLEAHLARPEREAPGEDPIDEALRAFYVGQAYRPLWFEDGRLNGRAAALAGELRKVDRHGLRPDDYLTPVRGRADADLAAVELALSRALIRYASDLAHGRVDPGVVEAAFEIERTPIDGAALLQRVGAGTAIGTAVAALVPAHPGYGRLQRALVRWRATFAAADWPALPPGDTLEVGARGAAVATLRRLLELTGDFDHPLPPTGDPELFDDRLGAAVARFQARHGLDPDGRVGRRTRAALAVTPEQRLQQIALNLERLRWFSGDLGRRHIFVNLADFSLRMVEDGVPVFQTRVVVGAPYHRTPVFSGQMTYIEINPYWHVPPSIARNEILPAVQDDPTWLIRNDMEVLGDWSHEARVLDPSTIDWRAIEPEALGFKFRQKPGPRNALGRIKFMLPNRFDVYLHDTPARSLFSRTVRSFSHGCIRVEQPETLASILLRDQPVWTRDGIDRAIASGERQVVRLDAPIPVHLTYLTSWVDDAGALQFRSDIYGRDDRLKAALDRAS